ncbi:hypothetical protein [Virgibacillus sp. Bac330]|uniref:hypothetical protein n=1 Tax=Virgibacillus sp. Bac330 TaxID=2419841 RepID=UPI0013CE5194|nr:hypothetical protein [Virgibacillus sp. Bac330]
MKFVMKPIYHRGYNSFYTLRGSHDFYGAAICWGKTLKQNAADKFSNMEEEESNENY